MKDRLPSRFPIVDSHIKALHGVVFGFNSISCLRQKSGAGIVNHP